MSVKDAVAARVQGLFRERHMAINELANICGITPSTLYSLIDPRRRDVSIITIKKICDGLELPLAEFFLAPEFTALEQEIE